MSAPWTWKIKELENGQYWLYRKHKYWPFWIRVFYKHKVFVPVPRTWVSRWCSISSTRSRDPYLQYNYHFPSMDAIKKKINTALKDREDYLKAYTVKKIYSVEIIEKMDAS